MTSVDRQRMGSITFSKHERLRGRMRVQHAASGGKAVHDGPFRITGRIMDLPTAAPAQVAFAVPKRHLKLAVQRNRMKRLMREAYRHSKQRWHEPLSAAGVQCAWIIAFHGRAPITLAETQMRITRSIDRWMQEHG